MTADRLPDSDIPGSPPVYNSPGLFAVHHVLRRLNAPRHPPYALTPLDSAYSSVFRRTLSVFVPRRFSRNHGAFPQPAWVEGSQCLICSVKERYLQYESDDDVLPTTVLAQPPPPTGLRPRLPGHTPWRRADSNR